VLFDVTGAGIIELTEGIAQYVLIGERPISHQGDSFHFQMCRTAPRKYDGSTEN